MTATDLLLKNYPEPGQADRIVSALFKSVGLKEKEIRAEAKMLSDWVEGKSKEDIEAALSSGDESTPLGAIAAKAKADEFWMYSRYFGIGMVKVMDMVFTPQIAHQILIGIVIVPNNMITTVLNIILFRTI